MCLYGYSNEFKISFTIDVDFDIEAFKQGKTYLYEKGEERGSPNFILEKCSNYWEYSINTSESCPLILYKFNHDDSCILKYIKTIEKALKHLKKKINN